jgi:hypothetical protein
VTATQVPAWPGTSQAWHWPLQAVSQQTPSTQLALAHWFGAPQPAPFASLVTQMPAAQNWPAVQSPSEAQLPRQAVGPQAKGLQLWVWTGGQLPAPSQEAARVAVPLVQLGARHSTEPAG